MPDKGWYDQDVIGHLEMMLQVWEEDCDSHWEDSEGKDAFERAKKFAKAVLDGSMTLLSLDRLDDDVRPLEEEWLDKPKRDEEREQAWWQRWRAFLDDCARQTPYPKNGTKEDQDNWLKRFADECAKKVGPGPATEPHEEDHPLRPVWDSLTVRQAWDAISDVEIRTQRMLDLYKLALAQKPSTKTQKYLSCLARCYVSGFDRECLILCRSVIDTAFRDTIASGMTLEERISAAFEQGVIDQRIRRNADNIRLRGNKAVHGDDIAAPIWETLCMTVEVVDGLYARRKGQEKQ